MEHRCFSCMNITNTPVCGCCGYNNAEPVETPEQEQLLRPGTMIAGRYYIGLPLDRNGEGVTYIAFDTAANCRVRVREFFPGTLCHRNAGESQVHVDSGHAIQYKALLTDMIELSKQLLDIRTHSSLLEARDILAENNTIYVIFEDVKAVTLSQYLRHNGGALSWEETENLFLPLLYTVKMLNANGIVHRGISPETILVTGERELKLKGLCTSAARAINTELKPELFGGYAAPEQYEKCSSHGEWTDVYAVCAVLYKTLTGIVPPRADIRSMETMEPPCRLDPSIPKTVSDAIMRGLEPERQHRTSFIKELIGDLYSVGTPEPSVAGAKRILDEKEESREPRFRKPKLQLPIWLIVLLVTLPLMILLFLLSYFYVLGPQDPPASVPSSDIASAVSSLPVESKTESSSPSSSASVAKYVVDDFSGKYYEDVVKSNYYQSHFSFKEPTGIYDESAPFGMILEQDVEANTAVPEGTEIGFKISKGPQYVLIPPTTDSNGNPVNINVYRQYFSDKGMEVRVEEQESVFGEPGDVIGTDLSAGVTVDRENVNAVTVYVVR